MHQCKTYLRYDVADEGPVDVVPVARFAVEGGGFTVLGLASRVEGLGFRVSGLRFRVEG